MMWIVLEATLDTTVRFLVNMTLLSLVLGIANVVRGKPLLEISWRRVALWSLVICALMLFSSVDRYRDLYLSIGADKNVSEVSEELLIETKRAVLGPASLSPDLHARFWSMWRSEGYSADETRLLVDNFLCNAPAMDLQLLFWSDVLVTLQTGKPFTSPERASLEAEHFSENSFVDENRQNIEKIAVGEPIESQGMALVVTEDYARLIYLELKEGRLLADEKCALLRDPRAFD
ncbi:hypothetical protein OAO91_05745 [Luminiphilus sp.]|nr:hypothetical protein [Luminiphilus sp.]